MRVKWKPSRLLRPEPGTVFGAGFGRAIEQEDLARLWVVPGSRVEHGQVLPRVGSQWTEDGIAFEPLESHSVPTPGNVAMAKCL